MQENEIIEAFKQMWGNFPEPVMITQKSREIVAVNASAEKMGLVPGTKCSSYGGAEQHKGCLCNKAVESGEPVSVTYEGPYGRAYGFWLPIADKPEWIIHFGIGQYRDYEKLQRPGLESKGISK